MRIAYVVLLGLGSTYGCVRPAPRATLPWIASRQFSPWREKFVNQAFSVVCYPSLNVLKLESTVSELKEAIMDSTFSLGSLSKDPNAGARFQIPSRGQAQFDDLGPRERISVWLLAGVGLVFPLLQSYCKFLRHRRLHVDDYFLITTRVGSENRRIFQRRGKLKA